MSDYRVKANIKIFVKDEQFRKTLYLALLPDINSIVSDRIKVDIRLTEDSILLLFQAKDLISLRALVNSIFRLIYSIETSLNVASMKLKTN